MRTWYRRWIAPPVFEGDEEKTRVASLLNVISFIIFGLVIIYTTVTLITSPDVVGDGVGVAKGVGVGGPSVTL